MRRKCKNVMQQIVGFESANVKCNKLVKQVEVKQETVLIVMKYFGQASNVMMKKAAKLLCLAFNERHCRQFGHLLLSPPGADAY